MINHSIEFGQNVAEEQKYWLLLLSIHHVAYGIGPSSGGSGGEWKDFFRGVGSAIAGVFKSKKKKKVITRSMARDKDSEGDDCDMMEEQKESVKPIAKKIVKPSFKELIAL